MTYQQAGRIAVIKRILGWVIFIPAVLSTLISVLKFMYEHSEKKPGIDAVMMDFAHVMIEMMRFNTPFLNFFWYNSPLPDFHHSLNIGFWIIFILVFVGMALQASGARMARQAKFLREGIEDQLILNPLAKKFRLPRHPRAGGLQRHADKNQNEDDPEADVQAVVEIRQRRVVPEKVQERRVKAHHLNHDMRKIHHYRVNAGFLFTVLIHKFEHRNQRRQHGGNKDNPSQNAFDNRYASSLLVRHEFPLLKTRW